MDLASLASCEYLASETGMQACKMIDHAEALEKSLVGELPARAIVDGKMQIPGLDVYAACHVKAAIERARELDWDEAATEFRAIYEAIKYHPALAPEAALLKEASDISVEISRHDLTAFLNAQ